MAQSCAKCKKPATKEVIWADGRAYQPSCDEHVKAVQDMLTANNGEMTELTGVQDLSEVVDLVASSVYPGLERKPGGPDNWVEAAGGLPSYIERIAKHLHYEKGFSIGRAIATAVNTVRRWSKGGTVTKHGTTKRITAATMAKAAAAVASWEAKKKAGSLALSEALLGIIDLAEVSEDLVFDLLDLADADISDASTMVCLMIPKDVASKIAVEGGVPAEDLHVTITFNKEPDEASFDKLVNDIRGWVKDSPMPMKLEGTIGGIGSFPADDPEKGSPWFVPVDVPGLNTLHEQMVAVSDRSAPAADNHGYTPHMTLTYAQDGDTSPAPVPATPVKFDSIWVVRGNSQRIEIPLEVQAGADLSERAILSTSDIDLSKGDMNIQALAERANQIEDPEARAAARAKVLDLASTIAPRNAKGKATDGRNSFKGQGKWKHGFIPANQAAHEAKAKGSPIAMKRTRRLFGKGSAPDDARKSGREVTKPKNWRKAATGRAGSRHVEGSASKRNPEKIKVDEKSTPGAEGVKDIGHLRRTGSLDAKSNRPSKSLGSSQKEASKSSRIPERATQNWDEIPETAKTIRNGKRYVLAEFGGKQYVTEWLGGVHKTEGSDLKDRKVMRSITTADAKAMSPSELRAMINNPKTPASVVKVLRKALRDSRKDA